MTTMRTAPQRVLLGPAAVLALLLAGCVAAAAGAGAAGAVYITDRGAESQVPASVATTYQVARGVFKDLGITETRTVKQSESGAEKRSLEGKREGRDVQVDLKESGGGTHVDVVVKKTPVTWDKDLAKQILNKIVEDARN